MKLKSEHFACKCSCFFLLLLLWLARYSGLLTLIPSQRDTARKGRNARNVRIERNAGISAAPAQMAPKFTNDN